MFRLFFLIIVVRKTYKIITSGHLFCLYILYATSLSKKNSVYLLSRHRFWHIGITQGERFTAYRCVVGKDAAEVRDILKKDKINLVRICEKFSPCVLCLENERFEHIQNPLGYFCNTNSIRTDVRDIFASCSHSNFNTNLKILVILFVFFLKHH